TAKNKLTFLTPPALPNNILSFATLAKTGGGVDLATYDPINGVSALSTNNTPPLTNLLTNTLTGATATTNVKLIANTSAAAAASVNALLVGGGATISGSPITVASGLIEVQDSATISANIVLGANATIITPAGTTLTITGAI